MKKFEMYHASYDSFENFDEKFITLRDYMLILTKTI